MLAGSGIAGVLPNGVLGLAAEGHPFHDNAILTCSNKDARIGGFLGFPWRYTPPKGWENWPLLGLVDRDHMAKWVPRLWHLIFADNAAEITQLEALEQIDAVDLFIEQSCYDRDSARNNGVAATVQLSSLQWLALLAKLCLFVQVPRSHGPAS